MDYGSTHAMPMVIINMGGEMVYILNQRLRAQNIPQRKGERVLNDVIRTMFSTRFIEELFKPQPVCSALAAKHIFQKLAHSSIMRLNESSMDKLYDLMFMGFKQQVLCSSSAKDLYQVSMNHLNSLKEIAPAETSQMLLNQTIKLFKEEYDSIDIGRFFSLKLALCRYFQGKRVKVSLFLQEGMQNLDGTFVLSKFPNLPAGVAPPGTARMGSGVTRHFRIDGADRAVPHAYSDRVELGRNLYIKERSKKTADPLPGPTACTAHKTRVLLRSPTAKRIRKKIDDEEEMKKAKSAAVSASASTARRELNMLAQLLGAAVESVEAKSSEKVPLHLNLFSGGPVDSSFSSGSGADRLMQETITFDDHDRASIAEMIGSLDLDDEVPETGHDSEDFEGKLDGGDDLLDLMDMAGV